MYVIWVCHSLKLLPLFFFNHHYLLSRPGAEKMYFFSQLAIEMNESEEGVAPTDSRLRPDQRCMEDGRWDEANRVKVRLEEKQREARKFRESQVEKAKAEGTECSLS